MKSLRFHGSWSAHMDPGPEFTYLCWGKKSSKRQKQNPLTATNLQHRCQKFTHQVLPNTISPPLNHKTLWWLEHNHHKCKQMRETDTQKVMLMLLSTALAGVAQWIECQTVNPKVASDSQSGHMPGLRDRTPVGATWEATTHWCFSPSQSPSPPLSLKINK